MYIVCGVKLVCVLGLGISTYPSIKFLVFRYTKFLFVASYLFIYLGVEAGKL